LPLRGKLLYESFAVQLSALACTIHLGDREGRPLVGASLAA